MATTRCHTLRITDVHLTRGADPPPALLLLSFLQHMHGYPQPTEQIILVTRIVVVDFHLQGIVRRTHPQSEAFVPGAAVSIVELDVTVHLRASNM